MRRLGKDDKNFLLSLLCFCFIAASRMFDHEMVFHSAPMGIMQQYMFACVVQTAYYLSMFLFFFVCLKRSDVAKRIEMYNLITLLCVFAVPLFLYRFYFGVMDVYAWILMLAAFVCMIFQKAEGLVVLFAFAATCICPMSFFYCICPLTALLLYQALRMERKKYLYMAVGVVLLGCVGVGITQWLDIFTTDAQQTVSWHKFIIILVLLSPYPVMIRRFWENVVQEAERKMRLAYVGLSLSGIPAIVVTAYVQDFARTIFMFFAVFIYQTLFLLSVRDALVERQITRMRDAICAWLPISAVVVAYPLVIMTLWVYGPLQIIVETLLGQ